MSVLPRFSGWMHRMNSMRDCDAVMRELWDYLDEQLTRDGMTAIQQHLEQCQRCWPHADFRRAFDGAVAGAREEVDNVDALRDRIRLALRKAESELPETPDRSAGGSDE